MKAGEDGIKFSLDVDTEEGVKNVKGLSSALQDAEKSAKGAETAANAFSNVIGGVAKLATGAFGMVTAVLKAPVDLDNYLGNLNQKITQVGGNLSQYQNILLEFKKSGTFRPGEGGFGLEDQDYKKIMMQFATGTAAVEKYGAAAAANLKGYTQGSGMLMKVLGFSPEQATAALTDLHKTTGLTFKEMEPFAKQLGAIGKNANLSSTQMSHLVGQVTKLSKAYGMGGEQARRFVLDSVQVGAAISQLGLNVQDTIAKMNEVASGSEEGLVQSLLLGFKPGDAKGQLAAFQNQAKMIVAQAQGAGEQMAPFLIRQMADAMGLKGFDLETIQRLAGGGTVEGPKGPKQADATDLLKAINANSTLLGKESPFVTTAQKANDAINHLEYTLITTFKDTFADFKDWLGKLPGFIDTAKAWFDKVHEFLGSFDLSLKNVMLSAAGLLLLPKLIGGTLNLFLEGVKTLLFGGAARGVAGSAVGGAAGLINAMGTAAAGGALLPIVGSVIAVVLTGLAAWKLGSWIREHVLTKEFNEATGDAMMRSLGLTPKASVNTLTPLAKENKMKFDASKNLRSGDFGGAGHPTSIKDLMGGGGSSATSDKGNNSIEQLKNLARQKAKKYGIDEETFLAQIEQESQWNPKAESPKGAKGLGQLMPEIIKKFGVKNPFDPDENLDAAAKLYSMEFSKYGDAATALAAYNAGDPAVDSGAAAGYSETQKYVSSIMGKVGKAGTVSSKSPTGSGFLAGLLDVHDRQANATLNDIRAYLASILHQQPAIAGSPSAPDDTGNALTNAMHGSWNAPPGGIGE